MAIPSWKIIPALVCGNTVVFKPSIADAAVRAELRQGARGGRHSARRRQHGDRRRRRRRHRAHRRTTTVQVVSFTGSTDGRPARSTRTPRRRSRKCISRWAARTSSWSWTMRSWSSRSKAACGAVSARPDSDARPPAASSSTRRYTTSSSTQFVARAQALRVGDGAVDGDADGAVDQRVAACRR